MTLLAMALALLMEARAERVEGGLAAALRAAEAAAALEARERWSEGGARPREEVLCRTAGLQGVLDKALGEGLGPRPRAPDGHPIPLAVPHGGGGIGGGGRPWGTGDGSGGARPRERLDHSSRCAFHMQGPFDAGEKRELAGDVAALDAPGAALCAAHPDACAGLPGEGRPAGPAGTAGARGDACVDCPSGCPEEPPQEPPGADAGADPFWPQEPVQPDPDADADAGADPSLACLPPDPDPEPGPDPDPEPEPEPEPEPDPDPSPRVVPGDLPGAISGLLQSGSWPPPEGFWNTLMPPGWRLRELSGGDGFLIEAEGRSRNPPEHLPQSLCEGMAGLLEAGPGAGGSASRMRVTLEVPRTSSLQTVAWNRDGRSTGCGLSEGQILVRVDVRFDGGGGGGGG